MDVSDSYNCLFDTKKMSTIRNLKKGRIRMVTDNQIRRLKRMLQQGKTLQQSADAVGIAVNTARKFKDSNKLPSELKKVHNWKTHTDKFSEDWGQLKEMLENNPGLEGKTIMDWLIREKSDTYQDNNLRTLQRRIKVWRATEGPDKEIYFPQKHYPGDLSESDFTHMDKLGISINGLAFDHLFYHFVLTYSNWESVSLCYSESFESLSEGFQNALWELSGLPKRHQTDNLSAAVVSPAKRGKFTERYQGLLNYYHIHGENINSGKPNENGDVEQSNNRFKKAVDQSLMLRGNRDFGSIESYLQFIDTVVAQRNTGCKVKFAEEVKVLRSLPLRRQDSWRVLNVSVGKSSTIRVLHNVYSVPSRLVGEKIRVLVKSSTIELYYAQRHIESYPRIKGENKQHIDYRHLIGNLLRKPGAFMNYRYREELYPNSFFRLAWEALQANYPDTCVKIYLGILHRAAMNSEEKVTNVLRILLRHHIDFSLENIDSYLQKPSEPEKIPDVKVKDVDLTAYDRLVKL